MTKTAEGALIPYRPRHAAAKPTVRCRVGLHRWSCNNSRDCKGDHFCLDCGESPNE